jgi:hypothetical protein
MNGKLQMAMFPPKSEWVPPADLPDITGASQIAIDVETKDPNLKVHGPGMGSWRWSRSWLCHSCRRLEMLYPYPTHGRRQP